jgi:hypothetical protein
MGLSALSVASVAALVRAELGPTASAEFCSACSELAGGNPLYVRELLAAARNERLSGADGDVTALRAVASSAVGASVLGRLARLGSDAVSLAQALAVLGSQTEVGVAAELAGLEPAAAELTADRLVAAQILAPTRPLDFFHPLIGEAVYADQALGARRLAHRRAAAILNRAGAADRVAAHLLATGPAGDAWVVQRLSAAADTAWERGAAEVAVADAAVVRKLDAMAGEVPKAFVVLKAPVTAQELMAWVAERVAGYKRVRQVEFTDSIPRSPAGKILRRLLVEHDATAASQVGSGDDGHGN